jgi:hypothetical protein
MAAISRREQEMEKKMRRLVITVCGVRPQKMSNGYRKRNQ